jgi:hypothetical protein
MNRSDAQACDQAAALSRQVTAGFRECQKSRVFALIAYR